MTFIILMSIAIVSLICGHFFKVLRWAQFVEIYEEPNKKNLLASLSIGQFVNFFIPYKLGDLVRALYSGRKMKNGVAFSFATVFVDRYLDVLVVGGIFACMWFWGGTSLSVTSTAKFYALLSLILLILSIIAVKYSKYPKVIMKSISSVFNPKIERYLLYFTWVMISSFKDIYKNVNKRILFFNTIITWLFYIISYYAFSQALSLAGPSINLPDVFVLLFSKNSIEIPNIVTTYNISAFTNNLSLYYAIYIVVPSAALLVMSFLPFFKPSKVEAKQYVNILPHLDHAEQLSFLEAYFSGNTRNFFKRYMEINRDIHIIQDLSAGSNATTLLCLNNDGTFFRKYIIGNEASKLHEQILWLEMHKDLKLAKILKKDYGEDYCYYNMEYISSAAGMFQYMHSVPLESSWNILATILNDLEIDLYKNQSDCDPNQLKEYIRVKVLKNLAYILEHREIKNLIKYDNLIINNIEYKNFNVLKSYLSEEYLSDVFKNDKYCDIHGDLTIENIVCTTDSYYLIDPNTGNIHSSPNLDYAKLLQSLHGGYEFFMKTDNFSAESNRIDFINAKSLVYNDIYIRYKTYMDRNFTAEQVKSIYFHELVHWIRLLPYKISKNDRPVLFYAGFIMAFNDIISLFEDK